jgi:Flp pilus assembly protein TadG
MPVARVRDRTASPPRCPTMPAACRCRLGRTRDDHGSSSVEFAILFPIIVILVFAGPQLAMWYFAREAAQAAATAAARAASAQRAAAGTGHEAGVSYLHSVGTGTITGYTVDETDTATTVRIHVHASVPNVIPLPGFSPTVDVTVVRGKERFTTPDSS